MSGFEGIGDCAFLLSFYGNMEMSLPHMLLSEIHILGSRTRERLVSPAECASLGGQGIRLCGLSEAAPPYRMIRPRLRWSETLVTLGGEGSVWLNGRWRTVRAGDAYLAPHDSEQAFFVAPGRRWNFVWVQSDRILPGPSPWLARGDGSDLAALVTALHHEVLGARDGTVLTHLAALVARLVERLGGAGSGDERLRKLWRQVDADLARAWTVALLAARAGVSGEHLRRLCLAELGTSPMAHVTKLRLRRAAALLRSSPAKIEAIAWEVGYGSVYSFSAAFKRWSGQSPGAWRLMVATSAGPK